MDDLNQYIQSRFPGEISLEFNEDRTSVIGAKAVIDLTEWIKTHQEWVQQKLREVE
jgi:hypothetical protein